MLVVERGKTKDSWENALRWPKVDVDDLGFKVLTIDGEQVVYYAIPWSQSFDSKEIASAARASQLDGDSLKARVFLPLQAWVRGVWFDGPIVRHDHKGQVTDFVPRGVPARLQLADLGDPPHWTDWCLSEDGDCLTVDEEGQKQFTNEEGPLDFLNSSVSAVADLVNHDPGVRYCFTTFSQSNLVAMVLLRMAIGNEKLYFVHATLDYKKWPPGVKRLCQNLGVSLYERSPTEGLQEVGEKVMGDFLGTQTAILTKAINQCSDVIPRRLLEN